MTCPRCGQDYDAVTINRKVYRPVICPHCAAQKNHDAVRSYQIQILPLVEQGKDEFTVHQKPDGLHIQMFGRKRFKANNQTWRAFCGKPANAGPDRRRPLAYRGRGWDQICEKCREAIEELLAEAHEQEAMRTQ